MKIINTTLIATLLICGCASTTNITENAKNDDKESVIIAWKSVAHRFGYSLNVLSVDGKAISSWHSSARVTPGEHIIMYECTSPDLEKKRTAYAKFNVSVGKMYFLDIQPETYDRVYGHPVRNNLTGKIIQGYKDYGVGCSYRLKTCEGFMYKTSKNRLGCFENELNVVQEFASKALKLW
jgi:hypothetical protein